MAKKKKHHWKKEVRAEIAAVMSQSQKEVSGVTPLRHEPTSHSRMSTTLSTPSGASAENNFPTYLRHDLTQIGWVALILLVFLTIAAITDHQTHWLDQVALRAKSQFSQSSASPTPQLSTSATSPALK